MRFVIFEPEAMPDHSWAWQFEDSNEHPGPSATGYPSAATAHKGCEDFITAMGGDPSTVTIEEEA